MNDNKRDDKITKQVGDYCFEFSKLIGTGYSSKVYKGHHVQSKQVVAIKVISSQTYTSPIQQTLLKNEIKVLLQIDHPNLLKVYEISQSANNTYIVSEHCNGGNLESLIQKQKLPIEKVLQIIHQISKGVYALHDKKILHRDIKPANVLIHNDVYKLADFGFAIIEDQFESIIKRFNVGTPMYMAPEILLTNKYSEKSDIWALGIMLYELAFHSIPKYNNIKLLHEDIDKKSKAFDMPQNVKIMLEKMLQSNPEDRITISEVVSTLQSQMTSGCPSPRIEISPLVKLNYQFVNSNLNSPLTASKQLPLDIRLKTKQPLGHHKAQTFDSAKLFATINQVKSVSEFEISSPKEIPKNKRDSTGQISTECSFQTYSFKKHKEQQPQLPAIIQPMYYFCLFLDQSLKKMTCKTEQQMKCNFLLRKLLAIKAKTFYSFAPQSIKDQLSLWINQLSIYYIRVENELNFCRDNTFEIFFNSQLDDQGKLLSMYLVSLMSQITLKETNEDFETLIDILQDNVKHQNDPFLFARKWMHNQQF